MDEKKKEMKKEEKVVEVKADKVKQTKKEEQKVEAVKETKKEEKTNTNKKSETATKQDEKKFEVKNEKAKKANTKAKNNTWIARIITVITVLAIAALLTFMIVTSSDPKKTVDGFLTNLKAGDFEKAQEFISGEKLLDENEFSGEAQKLFFDKITWKVVKVTKENDTATVEVEITNKDFKTIISNYMQKALKVALAGENITQEGIENYFIEELKNEQVQTTTQTKAIQLVREDKKWKVVSNDELVNVLLPGLQEVVKSLEN